MPYQITWKNGGLHCDVYGDVTFTEIDRMQCEVCSDRRFSFIKYFICNMTYISELLIEKDDPNPKHKQECGGRL